MWADPRLHGDKRKVGVDANGRPMFASAMTGMEKRAKRSEDALEAREREYEEMLEKKRRRAEEEARMAEAPTAAAEDDERARKKAKKEKRARRRREGGRRRRGEEAGRRRRGGAPHAEVTSTVRRGHHPHVTAHFRNGNEKTVDLRNKTEEERKFQLYYLFNAKGKAGGARSRTGGGSRRRRARRGRGGVWGSAASAAGG